MDRDENKMPKQIVDMLFKDVDGQVKHIEELSYWRCVAQTCNELERIRIV